MISYVEENYLKAIYKLAEKGGDTVKTNAIAANMNTTAASVTDMLKRLAEKDFVAYKKYQGVQLLENGRKIATSLIRKHRLWEVFLVEKLGFSWDEVHDIAEQLEHILSDELSVRLDKFLGYPKFDPHGDPIPDVDGVFTYRQQFLLEELGAGEKSVILGVNDHSTAFLQYLNRLGLTIGTRIEVLDRFEYDHSLHIRKNGEKDQVLSNKVCQNLFVKKIND